MQEGCGATVANLLHFAFHAVHIGRGAAEVADIALEIVHLGHLVDLLEDGLLRTGGDELALMRRDGTKATAPKTAPVHIDRKLDHLISRDITSFFVFGMRQTGIGQVKGTVDLLLSSWADKAD